MSAQNWQRKYVCLKYPETGFKASLSSRAFQNAETKFCAPWKPNIEILLVILRWFLLVLFWIPPNCLFLLKLWATEPLKMKKAKLCTPWKPKLKSPHPQLAPVCFSFWFHPSNPHPLPPLCLNLWATEPFKMQTAKFCAPWKQKI